MLAGLSVARCPAVRLPPPTPPLFFTRPFIRRWKSVMREAELEGAGTSATALICILRGLYISSLCIRDGGAEIVLLLVNDGEENAWLVWQKVAAKKQHSAARTTFEGHARRPRRLRDRWRLDAWGGSPMPWSIDVHGDMSSIDARRCCASIEQWSLILTLWFASGCKCNRSREYPDEANAA